MMRQKTAPTPRWPGGCASLTALASGTRRPGWQGSRSSLVA